MSDIINSRGEEAQGREGGREGRADGVSSSGAAGRVARLDVAWDDEEENHSSAVIFSVKRCRIYLLKLREGSAAHYVVHHSPVSRFDSRLKTYSSTLPQNFQEIDLCSLWT